MESFPRDYWDPKNIDEAQIKTEFTNNNKSILSSWFFLAILAALFLFFSIGLFCLLLKIFDFNQDILSAITPYSTPFWIFLTIKVSFLIVFLSLIIPLLKTFSTIAYAIIESIERKNKRYVDFIKFLYVLKYKGTIIEDNKAPSIINVTQPNNQNEQSELISLLNQIINLLQLKN